MKTHFLFIISALMISSCCAQKELVSSDVLLNNQYVHVTESQYEDSSYVWEVTYGKTELSKFNQQADKQVAFQNYIAYLEDIVEWMRWDIEQNVMPSEAQYVVDSINLLIIDAEAKYKLYYSPRNFNN